jgi:alpha-D-ribose 1-methylphosphonate 5-triphosphate synthase subunit PhnH
MKKVNIEKLNRDNFKSIMNALSMPGTIEQIESLYESHVLAVANTLLYSQVSYFYEGKEDFSLIEAITNTKKQEVKNSDYIFADEVSEYLFNKAKTGTTKEPEFSGTLIFKCKNFEGLKVKIQGPGIDGSKDITLPVDKSFIEFFNEKNSYFPLGNEVLFLNNKGQLMALSRTTTIEVI